MKVRISQHAIERFKKRFGEYPEDTIKKKICSYIKKAEYVSDNEKGVLLIHRKKRLGMILQNSVVVTVFNLRK